MVNIINYLYNTKNKIKNYQEMFATTIGHTIDDMIPRKIPVINIAAANMPAVTACCDLTVCGAYIMPSELK